MTNKITNTGTISLHCVVLATTNYLTVHAKRCRGTTKTRHMRHKKTKNLGLKDYYVPNINPDFHVGNIIRARVQREDEVRWCQTPDNTPKFPPYVKQKKKELSLAVLYALAKQLMP